MPASASVCSISAASVTAASGSELSGSTIARTQREAMPDATNIWASRSDNKPASIPMPRSMSRSQSSRIPSSPILAVRSSGSSVQAAVSSFRFFGSGSMPAEVVSDIGMPGQAERTARSAAAQCFASSVSRPCSSYGCKCTDVAPALTTARVSRASSSGVRGTAGCSRLPLSAACTQTAFKTSPFLNEVRYVLRLKHMSRRTETSYVYYRLHSLSWQA